MKELKMNPVVIQDIHIFFLCKKINIKLKGKPIIYLYVKRALVLVKG